ncbi:hypothetical protein BC829DRAFT_413162 [Chytridium lagenaria]|nr:hypothetical protein BC829DRAFT_413162 [Chytridium lagenaria]
MSLNTMDYALGLLQVPSSTLSPSVIGVSLERPTFNYALNQTFPGHVLSNGFAKLSDWFHERMKRVTKEVSEEEEWAKRMGIEYSKDVLDELWEPMVPESLSNALLSRFDWRKHLLKWMVEEGTGILVPPASLVLPSTAAEDQGSSHALEMA